MCKCTPEIRTPWCGKIGCEDPELKTRIAFSRLEDRIKFELHKKISQTGVVPQFLILTRISKHRLVSEVQEGGYSIATIVGYPKEFLGMRIVLIDGQDENHFAFGFGEVPEALQWNRLNEEFKHGVSTAIKKLEELEKKDADNFAHRASTKFSAIIRKELLK